MQSSYWFRIILGNMRLSNVLWQQMIFQNYPLIIFAKIHFFFISKDFNNEIVYIVQDRVDE